MKKFSKFQSRSYKRIYYASLITSIGIVISSFFMQYVAAICDYTLSHPLDTCYTVETEGHYIPWHLNGWNNFGGYYKIFRDDVEIEGYTRWWEDLYQGSHMGYDLNYDIDGLSVGNYKYEIKLYDLGQNYCINDEVWVSVVEGACGVEHIFIAMIGILGIALIFTIKFKKLKIRT